MIQFACPKCQHRLRAPNEAAGKSAKCRKCETRIRIPEPTESTKASKSEPKVDSNKRVSSEAERQPKRTKGSHPKSDADDLLQQIRDQFTGKVPRNHFNLPYQFGLLLVAGLMILLPLLYVGLIGGACYGMYWYFTEVLSSGMQRLPRGRAGILAVMMYVAPLIGGTIMILFMIKPLFFVIVPPRQPRRRSLKRAGEPALFELVDRICEATRSPKPKRIDIDSQVNASASFRRGLLSLLGKDLVLTIGAPLIAGMNTRQLTGVLAHEFGHFAQGGGMKTTFLIRSINAWFARVVYQRDQLDQMLEDGITESDFRISIILMLGKLFVIASRAIMWCFMMVAHTVSCFMMRQMEYDADRYEAHVSGSEQFANTARRLVQLAAGQEAAYGMSMAGVGKSVLLDDLPGLTSNNADHVSSKERKRLEKRSAAATESLFSTHPSDEKRIAAARKLDADGLFQIERPARELLKNFDAICTGVTVDFYRNQMNVMVDPNKLVKMTESQQWDG